MSRLHSMFHVLAALGLLLAACNGAPAPTAATAAATAAPADTVEPPTATAPAPTAAPPPGAKVTRTGFVCPDPQPRLPVTSKSLNLFVWTEYIPQDIVDCFQLEYGIQVNRDEYSSNEEMYAKLSSGSTTYDLSQPSDYIISVMVRTGLAQPLDKARLPNLANIDPNFLPVPGDPDGRYVVPYQAGTQAIVYNSDTVKTAPVSWKDLWNPEYKGRMVFVDDMRSVIGIVLLTEGKDINTRNPADLQAIKPRLKSLLQAVKLFDSDSPKTALIAGDVDLGYVWNAEAELAHRQLASLKYVFPSEGAIRFQDGYVILKDAPHADAAYAWLNYSLQGNVFWLMLRDFPYTNPNKAALDYARGDTTTQVQDAAGQMVTPADLYKVYMDSPITNTPLDAWKAGHNIDDVGDATPLYDQLWTEAKGS